MPDSEQQTHATFDLLSLPAPAAFTNPGSMARTVNPLAASRPTYWWFNEVSRLVYKPGVLTAYDLYV
jgi:hypothetical protein